MYRLSFADDTGNAVSARDTLFETENGAILVGVAQIKGGSQLHLYIEESDKPQSRRYAHFIPNKKVRQCLDVWGGDVRAAANALSEKG